MSAGLGAVTDPENGRAHTQSFAEWGTSDARFTDAQTHTPIFIKRHWIEGTAQI